MNVGFIGIGSMGAAMVPNLVEAGHRVSAWNRDAGSAEALENVVVLPSPVAAFDNEAVVTMRSNDEAVRSVIMKPGTLASACPGCVHVMMATISPVLSGELQARAGQDGPPPVGSRRRRGLARPHSLQEKLTENR